MNDDIQNNMQQYLFRLPNLNENFEYLLNTDHEGNSYCASAGCFEEGICRCYKIEEAYVEKALPFNIINILSEDGFFETKLDSISKERFRKESLPWNINFEILLAFLYLKAILKGRENTYFKVETSPGYYGDEIDGVYFADHDQWMIFREKLEEFNTITNTKRLHKILSCEYGYVLDKVEKYTCWGLQPIPVSDIEVNNHSFSEQLVGDYQGIFTNRGRFEPFVSIDAVFPGCLLVPNKSKTKPYRLIDGHHRFEAAAGEKDYRPFGLRQTLLWDSSTITAIVPI